MDAGFRAKIAKRLNRVRKYKGILHLSDKDMCDGKSLDPSILTKKPGETSSITFPLERPTITDFQLWNDCVKEATPPSLTLQQPLRAFLRKGHSKRRWFVLND